MAAVRPLVTIVQNDPSAPPGRLPGWFADAGADVRIVRVDSDPVPRLEDVGDALVVLGYSGSVESGAPWLMRETELLARAVEQGVPTLGICFGHQLLAIATGGAVTVDHPAGREFGVIEILLEPAAREDQVLGGLAVPDGLAGAGGLAVPDGPAVPDGLTGTGGLAGVGRVPAPSAHSDAVTTLPPGAIALARSDRYPNQAFRLGSALGVQFHPEASPDLMARWADEIGEDPHAARAALEAVDEACTRVGRALVEGFVASIPR